jgi:RNA polymerase sigma-70 factor (ECF subfamily)
MRPRGTDEELAAAAQRGDLRAYEELVERYQRFVFRVLWSRTSSSREDIEDLAQDTFVRAWERLGTYDTSRPFKSWIARVASNAAIDRFRSDSRRPAAGEITEIQETVAGGGPDPAAAALGDERQRHLLSRLKELPDHYREVIVLRFVEDLSYEEIAQALDLPLGSVKTRIFRGRELLKQRIDPEIAGREA